MRVTVCELPDAIESLNPAWDALRAHSLQQRPEVLLLPEFAFAPPLWQSEHYDAARWAEAEASTEAWLQRLPELEAGFVVGARPVTHHGKPYNEGFLWTAGTDPQPLRSKHFLPDEPGGWEARWFTRGDASFPRYSAGALDFGLTICTELWALEHYAGYAASGVHAILSPRATAAATTAKWLAVGTVAAVRSGAYSLSSNRVHADGSCGGVGWIISPDGELLARTSADAPFATLDIDLALPVAARRSYPRYVFDAGLKQPG